MRPVDDSPLAQLSMVVVDVETTGTRAFGGDRVTEVAAVRVRDGQVEARFESLVNPGRPIPPFVQRLTGITDAMVRTAPRFADIAGDLSAFLGEQVFVAHNAHFDLGFVSAELRRVGEDTFAPPNLCTVRLARRLLPQLPRRNLDALAAHYGVGFAARHRAMGDAEATVRVLHGLLDDAARAEVRSWGALQRLLGRRR